MSTRREHVLRWVSTVVRLALAAVWLVAGGLKVADPQASVQAVAAYELLPSWAEEPVGWGLPFAEIALGLVLAAGLRVRTAAVVSAVVLVVFIAGVISAWARGLSIDCGCFGGGGQIAAGQATYGREILRDLGFAALAGWLIVRPRSAVSLDHLHDDPDLTDEPALGDDLLEPGPTVTPSLTQSPTQPPTPPPTPPSSGPARPARPARPDPTSPAEERTR